MAEQQSVPSFSVSELEPSNSADVHGVIGNVSPMKKGSGKPFFKAVITDGEKQSRVVGFSNTMRKRLACSESTMDTVELSKCQVKKSKRCDDLEIVLQPQTDVHASPTKVAKDKVASLLDHVITLSQLQDKALYDTVTIRAKVLQVHPPVHVSPTLDKQDITISDSTAAAKLTLWQTKINSLEVGQCYEFKSFTVQSYRGDKHLSWPKEGAEAVPIGDLGKVAEDILPCDTTCCHSTEILAATISTYNACFL